MGDKESLIASVLSAQDSYRELLARADRARTDHDSQALQNQLLVKYIANLMQATGAAGQTVGGGVGTGQGGFNGAASPTGTAASAQGKGR